MTPSINDPVRRIALVGMMGTGKSTVAVRVAAALGWTCIDVDAVIESRSGRAISDIFAVDGEAAFRALEADVAADVLRDHSADEHSADEHGVVDRHSAGCVVALGGGAVLTPSTRDRLADCDAVVWLHAEPALLAGRLAADTSRPLLGSDRLERLAVLAAQREGIYRRVATHDIDVGGLTVDEVVARVVEIADAATAAHGDRR
jgi:shikimate kinase